MALCVWANGIICMLGWRQQAASCLCYTWTWAGTACKPEHIQAGVCLSVCVSRDLIINERCSFAVCLNGGAEVPQAYFRWCICCVFLSKYKSEQLWMHWPTYTRRVGMCCMCTSATRSSHEQVSAQAELRHFWHFSNISSSVQII